MAPTTLPRRNIVGPRIGGSASRRPAFPSLVPRERSTRGSGARTRGTRHAVGPRRERGPPARIPRRQARLPGDAGQRPALPSLVPRERSTRGSGARTRGNTARRWSSPGARAAGPHPAPTGAAPRGCGPAARAPKPRSTRAFNPRLRCADAGNTARRWSSPGARAAGPHPAPTGAAPRGCGPAARAPKPRSTRAFNPRLRCADAREHGTPLVLAGSAGRRPASRADRRGSPGMRASGPRSQASFHASVQPEAPVRGRGEHGTPLVLAGSAGRRPASRADRRGSPGMRASGPRSQASFHASVQPEAPVRGRGEHGTPLVLAGSAGRRPASRADRRGSPGMRASGPRSQASFHASVQPEAPVRGRGEHGTPLVLAGSAGRRPASRADRRGSPGMRASGPRSQASFHASVQPEAPVRGREATRHAVGPRRERGPPARIPRRQARLPGDAGQRPALPSLVPRECSTRGSGARTRGTRHAVGPRRERGPPARIPRRQARLPGDAGQRPALPSLVPRERSTRGSGARTRGTRHAVGPRRERGPPARIPRRQARLPGDAGQRPALPRFFPEISRPDEGRTVTAV